MRITRQAVTASRTCAICERTLLVGERAVRYSPDGENFVDVCPLCLETAADHGWLKAKHHFSFAGYHDPKRQNWGALRVWNDDEIAPDTGFPPHPHADMEIITYVRQGAITHEDSLGNKGRTVAGDVQVMSAGTGIRHSEYNLEKEPTKIFQIWIEPMGHGGNPSWGAKPFPKADRSGRFAVLASGFEEDEGTIVARRILDEHPVARELAVGREQADDSRIADELSRALRDGREQALIIERRPREQYRQFEKCSRALGGSLLCFQQGSIIQHHGGLLGEEDQQV